MTEVNLDVSRKIISDSGLNVYDREDLAKMVLRVRDTWLVQDVERGVVTVERTRDEDFGGLLPLPLRAVTDLELLSATVDWKVTGKLGRDKEMELRDSWQWRIYLCLTGHPMFHYRLVTRGLKMQTVSCGRYEGMEESVRRFVEAETKDMYGDDMRQICYPLPQHRPFACHAYKRPCPHLKNCRDATCPEGYPDEDHTSYSQIMEYMLCNERWRQSRLLSVNDSTPEAFFGSVFHAAVAAMYRPFVGLMGDERMVV